jgi:hypothetical protein
VAVSLTLPFLSSSSLKDTFQKILRIPTCRSLPPPSPLLALPYSVVHYFFIYQPSKQRWSTSVCLRLFIIHNPPIQYNHHTPKWIISSTNKAERGCSSHSSPFHPQNPSYHNIKHPSPTQSSLHYTSQPTATTTPSPHLLPLF